jgi:hypothetical protein
MLLVMLDFGPSTTRPGVLSSNQANRGVCVLAKSTIGRRLFQNTVRLTLALTGVKSLLFEIRDEGVDPPLLIFPPRALMKLDELRRWVVFLCEPGGLPVMFEHAMELRRGEQEKMGGGMAAFQ